MKYVEASSIEEVKKVSGTYFIDKEKNALHIHSPNPAYSSPEYAYKIIKNWANMPIELQRGEGNALNILKFFEENN